MRYDSAVETITDATRRIHIQSLERAAVRDAAPWLESGSDQGRRVAVAVLENYARRIERLQAGAPRR